MIEINEWLSISEISGSGDKEITISVSSHKELTERIKSLKFKAEENQVFVNITQKAFEPIFNIDNVPSFSQDILERTTTITSNVPWTAIVQNDWIHLSQTSGEEGTTNLTITVDDIETPSDNRSGVIDFYYNSKVISSLIIAQEFVLPEKSIIVIPTEIDMTNKTRTKIDVYSNSEWVIQIVNGDWFTLDKVKGNGNDTVIVNADTNIFGTDASIKFYIDNELKATVNLFKVDLVEGQFYIEPYNEGETITIVFAGHKSLKIYEVGSKGWERYAGSNSATGTGPYITTNKRIYVKDFDNSFTSGTEWIIRSDMYSDNLFKIGGKLSTLFTEYSHCFGLCRGSFYVDGSNGLMDASDLIIDMNAPYAFESCKYLTSSKLPQIDFTKVNRFDGMFKNCTSLTTAPELIESDFEKVNADSMFENCTSLVNAPKIIYSNYSCVGMFKNCTSLVNAPILNHTGVNGSPFSFGSMFYNCTSLLNVPDLKFMEIPGHGCINMFYGCTSLVNAPALPATVVGEYSCDGMFGNCTSLVNAPILYAEKLYTYSYNDLFYGCINLSNITMLAKSFYDDSLRYWTYNVSPTGTFTKKKGVNIPSGSSGIPDGWTVVEVD